MLKISVSLWSADLTELGSEVRRLENYADCFHFDVADGHFAKTFLFFPDLIKALRKRTPVPFEVHLITENPERFIDVFVESGADTIIFYPEATTDLEKTVRQIKKQGPKVSLALKPETSVSVLEPVLDNLDMVTVMGTEVDVKSRGIIPTTYEKITNVASLIACEGLKIDLEADGGIRKETVPKLVKAGATTVVAGSIVFNNDLEQIFAWLRKF